MTENNDSTNSENEKRFTLAYEKGNWWAVRDYDITLWKEEVISLLNELHEQLEPIQKICKKYNIEFTDVPEILEEYILIDNEVIEQKNIENIIKEAYKTERTALGKSVLKQLMEAIQ